MWMIWLLLCLTSISQTSCFKNFYSDAPTAFAWSSDNLNKYSLKKGAASQVEEPPSSSVNVQADLDSSSIWNIVGSELVLDKEAVLDSSEVEAGLNSLVWAELGTGLLEGAGLDSSEVQAGLDSFAWADLGAGLLEAELSGAEHLDFISLDIPAAEIDNSVLISADTLGSGEVDTTVQVQELVDNNNLGYFGYKSPKFGSIFSKEALKFPKFELPAVETVVVTEEDISPPNLPNFELPKFEKGPVKEIPVYVYKMPSWPEQSKLDLPKLEPIKEVPLVLYEMAPQEMEKFSMPKMPEIRIEKYILPPLPKLQLPKLEAPKEIPIVMYELPESKPLDLPKIKPVSEIPIVTFQLPPLPKMKPLNLPKIKMPQIKVVKKKLPPLPELKTPKLDFKLPEIKVIKHQMPEAKPLQLPKIPEIKFVKYEMPVEEKKDKSAEIKLPELKPFKLPELKLPEIKKMTIPHLPNYNYPEFQPMMPPVHYVYPPVALPMPYVHPFHHSYGGGVLNYDFGKFVESGNTDRPPIIVNSEQGFGVEVDIHGEKEAHLEGGKKPVAGHIGGHIDAYGRYHQHHGGFYGDLLNSPSSVILMTGNDAIVNGNEDVAQFFLAEGNEGLVLESSSPWGAHHQEHIKNNPSLHWLKELYDGSIVIKKTADVSDQLDGNLSVKELI